ncbi:hypothetical protein SCLCIDRAFT_138001, partial [Scleroderma citrinum Foug A]
EDRDHTDSCRIKPNSCNLLISEQLNPSKILLLEDNVALMHVANHLIDWLNFVARGKGINIPKKSLNNRY